MAGSIKDAFRTESRKTTTEAQEQENILKRDFSAQRPSEKFLTDITEVQCADGKLYVSPIMDCFSGEIVALEMRDNMKKELCIDTVRQLERIYPSLKRSGVPLGSRESIHQRSFSFAELSRCGMIQSLSGIGHCFDNARMESFFATLKKEKIYQIAAYKLPREQVKTIIFRYVFTYYNRVRIYMRNPLGLPPAKYREWAQAQTGSLIRCRRSFPAFRYAPLRKTALYYRAFQILGISRLHIS